MTERKQTILVTGSNGYIGYAVAKRLSESFNVVGFDRRQPSHPPATAECLYVDITSEASLRRGLGAVLDLHGDRLVSVIHLAAYYDFSGAPSPLYEKVTVRGTERLLRLLRESFTVEQFIFSSTMLVHASTAPGRPITDDSPLAPTWAYPQSKVRTEEVIRAGRGDIPAVILRIGGVYDDLGHSMPVPRQMQRIFERDVTACVFPGDLSHGQSFVHLDDLVDLFVLLVTRRHALPAELPLLVGEPETLSYDEMQRHLGRLVHGEDWKTRRIPKPLAKLGAWLQQTLPLGVTPVYKSWMVDRADDHYELDIARARTVVGWEPKRSLRQTLPKLVAGLKADPWAWYRENEIETPRWLQEVAPQSTVDMTGIDVHRLMQVRRPAGLDVQQLQELVLGGGPTMAQHGGHGGHEQAGGHDEHDAHSEHGAAHTPGQREDKELRAREEQLRQLRVVQAALWPAFEQELQELRTHDAEAQRLMETDPAGHIEMMRMPQEHKALIRELPRAVLQREAELYTEIARAREAELARMRPEPGVVMAGHVQMERWTQAALLSLGAWLAFSPSALGYRSAALWWSDVLSGTLVVALALLALAGHGWAPWANTFVGLWVMFAPLALWAPDPAAYGNDTLVGALVVAFAILVPMRMTMTGRDVPVGWTYSPSSWLQRAPIIALGLLSFFMSRYMTAFQLGHITWAWDPFFGNGTVRVLTSEVSRAFPISDAGLGAYTYMIEVLSGLMGDERRWRTMPWMVALFGFAVVPLGIISVVLIILQPLAVGAWCTLCLASALLMLIMVVLSLDEVFAMIQYLIQSHRAGRSAWRVFWLGGNPLPYPEDIDLTRRHSGVWAEMFWGANVPPTLLLSALLGAWLMTAPAVFGSQPPAAHSDHLLGALVVVVALIAMAEIARGARFLNILLALGLIIAPWVLPGAPLLARLNDLVAGAIVIGLSLPRGAIRDRYGWWNPYIV